MLFYPIPQSLGCASYIARITLTRKFINNRTFLVGRNAILLNGSKSSPSAVNSMRIDSKGTFYDCLNIMVCRKRGYATRHLDGQNAVRKSIVLHKGIRKSETRRTLAVITESKYRPKRLKTAQRFVLEPNNLHEN